MIDAETLAEWKYTGDWTDKRVPLLIAEVEHLQELLAWWKREYDHKVDGLTKTMAERDALQAQVDAVKALCDDAFEVMRIHDVLTKNSVHRPCESASRLQFAKSVLAALGEAGDDK